MFLFRRKSASVVLTPSEAARASYVFGRGRAEIDRLDMQHFMFRLVFRGDYSAPLNDPHNILDVACGTGLWARTMAQRFPEAVVLGFDKNAAQFNVTRLPPNCTLMAGDAF